MAFTLARSAGLVLDSRPSAPVSRANCSCSPLSQTPSAPLVRWPHSSRRQGSFSRVRAANETVSDYMTGGAVYTCKADDSVDDALELLVTHRITGLPVVDENKKVVGVVSDFDLLALDTLGKTNDDFGLFPQADETWQAFKSLKALVAKSAGKKVKDVMTSKPIVVKATDELEGAAKILLSKKIHRLPVVDDNGTLVGVLSRGNIIKAALAARKAAPVAN